MIKKNNFFFILRFLLFFVLIPGGYNKIFGPTIAQGQSVPSPATIAILSHTDFLPDATGVYDRRSWNAREKEPGFVVNNDSKTDSDQAYDKIDRSSGYDPEAVGLPEVLADAILEQLSKSKRFIPVERKALRTTLLEQRFGKDLSASYLDRTLDKAIQDMDKFEVGGAIGLASAISGSKYNDLLHDFKDLGSVVGADYLVVGNLHQLGSNTKSKKVPLSESGKTFSVKTAEARLRLRVIDTATGNVLGADSLHLKVSKMLFEGGPEQKDDFEFIEQVSQKAANKILDLVFPAKIVNIEPLIISRGSNDGLAVGDTFSILREGEEIKESNGVVIARLKEPVGHVKVTKVQETISVVIKEQGQNPQKGDLAVKRSIPNGKGIPLKNSVALQPSEKKKELPRVAIGLVKTGSTAKTGPDAGKHIPTFTDTILTELVKTRRFTVIDRQEVDQLLDEQTAQALAANRELPSALGSLKGCDYLMIGSLQNFSMEEDSIKLPNSSRVMEVLDGFAEGNMRLVEASSGDIIESRKISVRKQLEIDAGDDRLIAALADRFAVEVVANLINAIYPMKVAAVSNGTIYLNRGKDGLLTKGSLLNVLRSGQKVIDPDTGVHLGSVDTQIGQVKIIKAEENRSIAKVVDGEGVAIGDLVKVYSKGLAETDSNLPERSGAVLPGSKTKQSEKVSSQQGAGTGGKATLAVSQITLNTGSQTGVASNSSIIQKNTMDVLTDNMVDALSRTNRFNMMERRMVDQVIDEKTFNAAAQRADIREYLKELQGSDYLVVGQLTNFYLKKQQRNVAYLNETEVTYTGFMEGNIRIIDSHTSGIVSTEKIRIQRKYKNISINEIHTKLVDHFVENAAAGIVQRIYPMKILAAMPDGTIFINRGQDAGIKNGATFSVERPGQELIDPDTGVSFGNAETTIGTLKITQVETSRSRAQMVEGGEPAAGDILRATVVKTKTKPKPKMKVAW